MAHGNNNQMVKLPRLYAIADRSCFADSAAMYRFVEELLAAGVTLIQYRNKQGSARDILQEARELRRIVGHPTPTLPTPVRVGHPQPTLATSARVGHPGAEPSVSMVGLVKKGCQQLYFLVGHAFCVVYS